MFNITTANQVRQTSHRGHKAQRKSQPVGLSGVRHYERRKQNNQLPFSSGVRCSIRAPKCVSYHRGPGRAPHGLKLSRRQRREKTLIHHSWVLGPIKAILYDMFFFSQKTNSSRFQNDRPLEFLCLQWINFLSKAQRRQNLMHYGWLRFQLYYGAHITDRSLIRHKQTKLGGPIVLKSAE